MKNNIFKKYLFLLLTILSIFLLVGCVNNEIDYSKYTKVVFKLEGGTYLNQNIEEYSQLYELEDDETTYIYDPNEITKEPVITKDGCVLEGWYRSKVGEGDDAVYSDKWDFTKYKMGKEGVTLYANWVVQHNYTFDIYYTNSEGQDVQITNGSYQVEEGAKFDDYRKYAEKFGTEKDMTFVEFLDANGNKWDENFVHPGGDEDLSIKVYARYIQGKWSIVKTAEDLILATDSIYLMNDIDFEGQELNFANFVNKTFEGNNHTISNFTISYQAENIGPDLLTEEANRLNIGLFTRIYGSTIQNVKFIEGKCDVNTSFSKIAFIHVSPFAVEIEDSTIQNVEFECNVTITRLPEKCSGYEVQENQMYYKKDDKSTVEGIYHVTVVSLEA